MQNLKEQAELNLRDLYLVTKEHKINFCLMDGTLLGAYRDKDFCVNDYDDLDIGILDEDYDVSAEILVEGLSELGFEKKKELIHNGKLEGFGLERGGSHFDVIRVNRHPKRAECYNVGRTEGEHKIMAFVYSSKHFDKFGKIKFKGLWFKTPYDPDGFLTERYGNWNHKIERPAFEWWTQSNNNSIREDYDQI